MNSMHGYNERINKNKILQRPYEHSESKDKVTQVVQYDTIPLDEGIGS